MADALNDRCNRLIALNDDVESAAKLDGWLGDAAVAAASRGNSLISTLEQKVAEASAVRRGAHEVQLAVERLTAMVRETEDLAHAHGVMVGTDGAAVIAPVTGPPLPPDVAARQAKALVEIHDRVEQIVRRAIDVDADLAGILTRAMRGEITEQGVGTLAQAAEVGAGQSGLSIIGPPEHGTPGENNAWWDSLSDTAKGAILRDNPDLVRNLDGIPVVDRDSANRAVLNREIEKLKAEASDIARTNPNDPRSRTQLDWPGKEKLDAVNAKINGLHAIENRLNQPGPGVQQAFLISLDTSADGKAVVSSGNPDTAANVATYVPGTGSELSKIEGDMNRSDRMVGAAAEMGSPSTAVVTWLGYDAPNGLVDAGSADYADGGKAALGGFQDGLRATHQGDVPSHNTVLGHSYGTTVVGYAARDGGLNADELAFVASPGVGVDNASELHLTGVDQADIGSHVHSTVAEHDMIKVTNIEVTDDSGSESIDIALGPDPARPQFGGQVFTSDPGTDGQLGLSTEAHSEYWNYRSKSLDNMGRIIAGRPTS
ncbi:alpha/beta hydrolase [Amycolatopsis sp. H20-H5]|uniref:alpha/beta hydrolase n=1 Tax=Amycolatopsis sp. H20-H5 TaxID=3046309 RepID=UPI002DBFF6CF|nr:alpha/beta hydrolase [Amycolatopsis sp. H20-H5]MEC3982316.1 alpha/beta hydrolase [Amycolatopsis sp. H20-H5]